jgi:hypothetical protein
MAIFGDDRFVTSSSGPDGARNSDYSDTFSLRNFLPPSTGTLARR